MHVRELPADDADSLWYRGGFHAAIGDLQPVRQIVVVPGREGYATRDAIQVMPLRKLCEELATR